MATSMRALALVTLLASACLIPSALSLASGDEPTLPLFTAADLATPETVAAKDASYEVTAAGRVVIRTGHAEPWPGVTLKAPHERWDLSTFAVVETAVTNRGGEAVTVHCRVDNPGADGARNCLNGEVRVEPGATETLRVRLCPTPWSLTRPLELFGMRAAPGPAPTLDASRVTQVLFFVNHPQRDHRFEVGPIRAAGHVSVLDADKFLPFIDELGQFIHADWPGKTHSAGELAERADSERADLEAHPEPPERDAYGGWAGGPRLEATGFFRVAKRGGMWWLVDPDGCLFWSHGVDCVTPSTSTPITDREDYFRGLPAEDSPLARFYGRGSWAPHGYYREHSPYRTFDFGAANLLRKYGDDWRRQFADVCHRRLRSWGLNTIANWSSSEIYQLRRTPYVATISFSARPIAGSEGYWGKFDDVFDPGFRAALRRRMEGERDRSAGDPWCLGYFVQNEISWGDDVSLALAALASPADQPAKRAFVEDLRAKYDDIAALNAAWGTEHASWDALLDSRDRPDERRAGDDLRAFYTRVAETYFRTVREEVKRVAPQQLYLGCRFAWVNDRAARAATKYCDVVSYNRYTYSVADLSLPDGIDMPVIIGEFHFGALDRGMFHTGLRSTGSQEERADAYRRYVEGALANPLIVGTHWFQYRDQATTGRGDGEDYQIGLVDICDTPYPEMVATLRSLGRNLFKLRLGAGPGE